MRCTCAYRALPHYHCANCGADCTAGEPAAPAHADTDGATRCDKHHHEMAAARRRLEAAASDLADVLAEARQQMISAHVASDCDWCGGEGGWTEDIPPRMTTVQHKADCVIAKAEAALLKAGRL